MSCVANVLIQFDCLEPDVQNVAKLHEITERLCQQRFRSLVDSRARDLWGGSKAPECDLFGAAFNYIPLDEFFAELEKLEWECPNLIRVFVQRQDDNAFGVWVMREGKMVCVLEADQD